MSYGCFRESGGVDPYNHPYIIPICTYTHTYIYIYIHIYIYTYRIRIPTFTPPLPPPVGHVSKQDGNAKSIVAIGQVGVGCAKSVFGHSSGIYRGT